MYTFLSYLSLLQSKIIYIANRIWSKCVITIQFALVVVISYLKLDIIVDYFYLLPSLSSHHHHPSSFDGPPLVIDSHLLAYTPCIISGLPQVWYLKFLIDFLVTFIKQTARRTTSLNRRICLHKNCQLFSKPPLAPASTLQLYKNLFTVHMHNSTTVHSKVHVPYF